MNGVNTKKRQSFNSKFSNSNSGGAMSFSYLPDEPYQSQFTNSNTQRGSLLHLPDDEDDRDLASFTKNSRFTQQQGLNLSEISKEFHNIKPSTQLSSNNNTNYNNSNIITKHDEPRVKDSPKSLNIAQEFDDEKKLINYERQFNLDFDRACNFKIYFPTMNMENLFKNED